MTRLFQWFSDLITTIRELARDVAYTRAHPTEMRPHEDDDEVK